MNHRSDHQEQEPFIVEHRRNARLRSIYDDARIRVDKIFHGHTDWVDSSVDFLARRLVHETYPELSGEEVRTLTLAIERHVKTEHPHA